MVSAKILKSRDFALLSQIHRIDHSTCYHSVLSAVLVGPVRFVNRISIVLTLLPIVRHFTVSICIVSLVIHELFNVGLVEELMFHRYDTDVQPIEWYRLKDFYLCTFHVQTEVIDLRPIQGNQHRLQREARHDAFDGVVAKPLVGSG